MLILAYHPPGILRLNNNRLTGSVPSELSSLNRLSKLLSMCLSDRVPPYILVVRQLTLSMFRYPYHIYIAVIRVDSNQLGGTIPEDVCGVFEEIVPAFFSDCSEFQDDCACCTHCCSSDVCQCRYQGALEYLCFQARVDEP